MNHVNLALISKCWGKCFSLINTNGQFFLVVSSQQIDDLFDFKYNHIFEQIQYRFFG